MAYTVGTVATLAHVSVRTLHHYNELGLLVPSERSKADYRLYTDTDLDRLQSVLFYKELGFSLQEIRELVDDPAFDRREALVVQRDLIAEQALRFEAMLSLIDKTLTLKRSGCTTQSRRTWSAVRPRLQGLKALIAKPLVLQVGLILKQEFVEF
ncbi:MAG: MerR family transcriptional regulator [Coriobacteriia bacterium]|nr:MerR family transcriptional regulator [Coriobacteriia bacterium]